MIQLSDVQVFLEIVSAGSFTAAARALKTPKSSVARQIARLEQELGCVLLTRSTRVVALTEAGRSFLPHARRLLDDGIEAQNVFRSKGKGASGLLTIAATGLIGRRFIVPHLPAFRERHPNIRIALWLGRERHEIGSGDGEADIALRLRTIASPEIGNQKLGEIDFRIVAAPAYLERRGVPEVPEDLAKHEIIELGPPGKHSRLVLTGPDRTATVAFAPPIHIDDPEAVRIAAIAGGGMAILPRFLVAQDVRSGALRTILDDWRQAPVPLHALYRTHVAPPIRVRAYLDYLLETVGRAQPWRDED
jgi:DNA-binding transcriptional LysR family regulator